MISTMSIVFLTNNITNCSVHSFAKIICKLGTSTVYIHYGAEEGEVYGGDVVVNLMLVVVASIFRASVICSVCVSVIISQQKISL